MNSTAQARIVMDQIEALARISEEPGRLTRTFASPAMTRANELVGGWMREAGMTVSRDAIGNLIGRFAGATADAKTLIIGSHLDTVRDAGKYDGPLGVLAGIACVRDLHERGLRLPFAVEVIGFADEEGVRFQSTYLGSRAFAGTFEAKDLARTDAQGISMAAAIREFGGDPAALETARRNPADLLGYVEVHIEQGPALEKHGQPAGVVYAIAGQTRAQIRWTGHAGHAGTTPMSLRHDALTAAAEFILAAESCARDCAGLVATVGRIAASPGAVNVIPGEVTLSLDVRHAEDATRSLAGEKLRRTAEHIAEVRGVKMEWETTHQAVSVACAKELSARLARAAERHVRNLMVLPSGAGHDAAVMGGITPMAMLFVRCKGGLSHHPAESVTPEDVAVALAILGDFLGLMAGKD